MKLYKNYAIYYVCKGWGEGLCKVLNVCRRGSLPKSKNCEQEARGYKLWSFCDNIIIECP